MFQMHFFVLSHAKKAAILTALSVRCCARLCRITSSDGGSKKKEKDTYDGRSAARQKREAARPCRIREDNDRAFDSSLRGTLIEWSFNRIIKIDFFYWVGRYFYQQQFGEWRELILLSELRKPSSCKQTNSCEKCVCVLLLADTECIAVYIEKYWISFSHVSSCAKYMLSLSVVTSDSCWFIFRDYPAYTIIIKEDKPFSWQWARSPLAICSCSEFSLSTQRPCKWIASREQGEPVNRTANTAFGFISPTTGLAKR